MQMIKQKIAFEIKNHLISWFLFIVVIILSSLFINENKEIFTSPREFETITAQQTKVEEIAGEITGNSVTVQSFISNKQSFSRIQIPFGTYMRQNEGEIVFELRDSKGISIVKKIIPLKDLKDGAFTNIDFETIEGTQGKKFEIVLNAQDLQPGKSVTLLKSAKEQYADGELIVNGTLLTGDLKFKVLNVELKPLIGKKMFNKFVILLLTVFLAVTVLTRLLKDKIHYIFLVITIPIGIILSLLIPPFDQLDEHEHFYRAYEVSAGKFTNQETEHGLGNYIPESLVNTVEKVRYIHQEGLRYNIVFDAFSIKLNPDDEIFLRNYASSYSPVLFIPQSFAIIIGKFFEASPIMMMYLGRIFNLIAYVAISFAALKIVPIKKKLFFLLALLPMSIIHAASLSADGVTNASALLFAAYIFYLAYGKVKTVSIKQIMIAIAIGIFIAQAKIVYFPILLLFLIIPASKFKNKKSFWSNFIFVMAGCTLPFVFWNLLNISNLSVPDLRVNQAVSPKDQIQFVLSHPLQYSKVMLDTMMTHGPGQLTAMIGKIATNYEYFAPSIVIFTFLFLLFIFGTITDEGEENIVVRGIDRFIFLTIFVSVVVLIYTALYVGFTNVGNPIINGIQGRYFIPVAAFFFLSLSNPRIINKDKNIDFLVVTIINSSMFALFLQYIVNVN